MEKSNKINLDTDSKKGKGRYIQEAILFLTTFMGGILASYLYGKSVVEIARIGIIAAAGGGSLLLSIEQSAEADDFLFDNREHPWRFMLIYISSLCGCFLFPILPSGGWPYLAIFIGLMLFSNQMIGISAGTVLLILTSLLFGLDLTGFFVYFIGGMVGILVFSYVDDTFQVGIPLIVSLMVQWVCLSLEEILFVNEKLNIQMFFVPTLNLLVTVILLLVLLKYFSYMIIYKKSDLFMDINDPECALLSELKSVSKEEYYHAVHTAYLCDRIAKRLNMDAAVAKACGYYHHIGVIRGENNWENVQIILDGSRFPEQVKENLKEYLDRTERIIAKETVVLLFSDTVISSIKYLFSKSPDIKIDYSKIIEEIFKKRMESGMIEYSDLTYGELQEMKKILMEEKLYYDFLR